MMNLCLGVWEQIIQKYNKRCEQPQALNRRMGGSMKKLGMQLMVLALLFVPAGTTAADVLSPEMKPLDARERRIVDMIRGAASGEGGTTSFMQGNKLVFVHGAADIPTIVAAPLQVVDVELEAGEIANELVIGDSARWQVVSGTAGRSTHLFIKPLDVGLETMVVVTTDRRVYHLRLISRKGDITPYVGFVYQNDLAAQLAASKAAEKKARTWQTTDTGVDLANLNFGYRVSGSAPWKPERVYDDGRKLYIQLPSSTSTGEMPALLVKKGRKDVLVNYRVKGRTMEVDGLFPHIALVVGVGRDQELVEVRKEGAGNIRPAEEIQAVGGNR